MLLRDKSDILTLALIILCYCAWGVLTFGSFGVPGWVAAVLLVPVVTFHSSLQHEVIHGHPFEASKLNDLIAYAPIGIFLPYTRYKSLHLAHHQNASISDPLDDPESWYLPAQKWQQMPKWQKTIFTANNTLVGRMLLGPLLGVSTLFVRDMVSVSKGQVSLLAIWGLHLMAVSLLLAIIGQWSVISIGTYLLCAYLGMSILMIRTYLEHQAHETIRARSVIIEDKGILSLLFLNNNLHAVHHAYPMLAWYRLPGIFKRNRDRFMKMNTGYHFNNYWEIFRKYTFSAKEPVAFPFHKKP